jgi:uncharacterized protein (TIGR02145 family)
MKKLLFLTTILSLVFISCGEEKPQPEEKGWDTSLGKASFATDSTWIIVSADSAIIQEWSDAVQTLYCGNKQHSDYDGVNSRDGYNIDCYSRRSRKGDLFSWRAVAEVEDLCPEGWRVPTCQDFINLDIALGGDGQRRDGEDYIPFINENYFGRWGGTQSFLCTFTLIFQGGYWSQSESNANNGLALLFNVRFSEYFNVHYGNINPQDVNSKSIGIPLRCVRDTK